MSITPPTGESRNQPAAPLPQATDAIEESIVCPAAPPLASPRRRDSLRQQFRAKRVLGEITHLSPELLTELGVKGVIFDLDDTLMPERSGHLSEGIAETLTRLKTAGFKLGIVTNNFQSGYCKKARQRLHEAGLGLPMIEDAAKPHTASFCRMANVLGVSAGEMAVVGDGILTDVLGARRAGMTPIRVDWFRRHSLYRHDAVLMLREALVIGFDRFRHLLRLTNPALSQPSPEPAE